MDSPKKELLIASRNGNADEIRRLIERVDDVNYADENGNTVLHHAVTSGSLSSVEYLLEKDPDISLENNENETPYDIACQLHKRNILKALEDKIVKDSISILKDGLQDRTDISDMSSTNDIEISTPVETCQEIINTLMNAIEISIAVQDDIRVSIVNKLINREYAAIIETDDLIKLMVDFIQKMVGDNDHHDVCIGREKLNFCKTVCDKMPEIEHSMAHDIHPLPLKYWIEKELLQNLSEIIKRSSGETKYKALELTKSILKLVNNVAWKLSCRKMYHEASAILWEITIILDDLIQERVIEVKDLMVYQTKCNLARAINQLGKKGKVGSNKFALHEKALGIFYGIRDTLRMMEESENLDDVRDIERREKPLYFLILSEIAYTKNLLMMYEESCEELELLYKNIKIFVMGSTSDASNTILYEDEENFTAIDNSEKYKELLAFSDESRKYLDVLNIKNCIGFIKVNQAKETKYYDKSLLEEGLEIHKSVYRYRNGYPKSYIQHEYHLLQNVRYISYTHNALSHILYTKPRRGQPKEYILKYFNDAIQLNHKSLVICIRLEKQHLSDPKFITKFKDIILISLRFIAKVYFELGKITENATNAYEEVLLIENEMYEICVKLKGATHSTSLYILIYISNTYKSLGQWEKSKEMMSRVYLAQRKELGENHPNTKKARNFILGLSAKISGR